MRYVLHDNQGTAVDEADFDDIAEAATWAYEQGRQRGIRDWELRSDGDVKAWPGVEDDYVLAVNEG
jgi:hypothetical protein